VWTQGTRQLDAVVERVAWVPAPLLAQDEEGDAFYIIIEGKASVIRVENMGTDDEDESLLANVEEGAYFGERALLKSQVRFAGVRADTKLKCMCITRVGFEEILGPLQGLVPDKY
jgi:CRP-like cAMP-binding protein